jgi:hypothetical protein
MIRDLLTTEEVKEMSGPEVLHWIEIFMREQQIAAARKALLDHLEIAEASLGTGDQGDGKIIPFSG